MSESIRYYRIGKLIGHAGRVTHVAFENTGNGGRLIFADSYKNNIHHSDMDKERLTHFYEWLVRQIKGSKRGGEE